MLCGACEEVLDNSVPDTTAFTGSNGPCANHFICRLCMEAVMNVGEDPGPVCPVCQSKEFGEWKVDDRGSLTSLVLDDTAVEKYADAVSAAEVYMLRAARKDLMCSEHQRVFVRAVTYSHEEDAYLAAKVEQEYATNPEKIGKDASKAIELEQLAERGKALRDGYVKDTEAHLKEDQDWAKTYRTVEAQQRAIAARYERLFASAAAAGDDRFSGLEEAVATAKARKLAELKVEYDAEDELRVHLEAEMEYKHWLPDPWDDLPIEEYEDEADDGDWNDFGDPLTGDEEVIYADPDPSETPVAAAAAAETEDTEERASKAQKLATKAEAPAAAAAAAAVGGAGGPPPARISVFDV